MADWTNITDSQVDPDAPLTSELAYAWRDNPIAITEGATGAPRISFQAIGSWYSTYGAVGSLVMARSSNGTIDPGSSVAGSTLVPSNAAGATNSSLPSLSGTWRALGVVSTSAENAFRTTLFVRIA